MRTMIRDGIKINVVEHIILRNFWEYYVTDDKFTDDIVRCLVLGAETEIGDVFLNEIKPYILSRTNNLANVMPAPGYSWE